MNNNTRRSKKLATFVSCRKYVTRHFVRRKQARIPKFNSNVQNQIQWQDFNAAVLYFAVIFRHSCLPVFAWRRVVLHIFDPKQLLRVSCMLSCHYPKCYSINSNCNLFLIGNLYQKKFKYWYWHSFSSLTILWQQVIITHHTQYLIFLVQYFIILQIKSMGKQEFKKIQGVSKKMVQCLFCKYLNNQALDFQIVFFSWKLRSICKFWIQNNFCATLGGQDIYKTKCGSETDQFISILS